MHLPHPVIFVPGITASCLKDFYPMSPELIWSVLKKKYDRILLHPDNLQYESQQPAMVQPDQLFEIAYEEFIEDLRDELTNKVGHTVPVFPFSYDWRHPLEYNQQRLADFAHEVVERTQLLPHYNKEHGENVKVNFVGHSMGGMVIARMLSDQKSPLPVGKVISLATPFKGSFEAIVKLSLGVGNLGVGNATHSERRAARVTPSLYQLLPAFQRGISVPDDITKNMFSEKLWQDSIHDTLTDFVGRYGLPPKSTAKDRASGLLKLMLKAGSSNARKIRNLDLSRHGLSSADWLAVVGVDAETRIAIEVNKSHGKSHFNFSRSDCTNQWDDDSDDKKRNTGDGTVPFEGAIAPFLEEKNLVLITPKDYGFWELADKGISKLGGFHGLLTNMNLVQRIVFRFLMGAGDRHNNTWGRPAPGVSPEEWAPPMALNLPPKENH